MTSCINVEEVQRSIFIIRNNGPNPTGTAGLCPATRVVPQQVPYERANLLNAVTRRLGTGKILTTSEGRIHGRNNPGPIAHNLQETGEGLWELVNGKLRLEPHLLVPRLRAKERLAIGSQCSMKTLEKQIRSD